MSFVESFWSPGYTGGLDALFGKLQQGIVENAEVIALAGARADIEEAYGQRLAELPAQLAPKKTGFARDDGATLRTTFEGVVGEMGHEGSHHLQVADNIRVMVVEPFGRWAEEHKARVNYSQGALKKKVKQYERELAEVHKAQKRYFNKCRLLEDFKDSTPDGDSDSLGSASGAAGGALDGRGRSDSAASGVSAASAPGAMPLSGSSRGGSAGPSRVASATPSRHASTRSAPPGAAGSRTVSGTGSVSGPLGADALAADLTSEELVLDSQVYDAEVAQKLVARMLHEIAQGPVRVSILGTYEHVSTGSAITEWLLANLPAGSAGSGSGSGVGVGAAERVGQDLVHQGFLRLVGQVGSKFANSSVMLYQWRPRAWEFAGISHGSDGSGGGALDSLTAAVPESWSETVSGYWRRGGGGGNGDDGDDGDRLAREVRELDQKYRKNVSILDNVRCELEEMLVDHLKFMERCELDRLKAVKAVVLDFVAAVSNAVPYIQASVDKLLLFQETANPVNDLRYIAESYRTGSFAPKVTVYDNYYSSADGNIFGMDLELRCRGDRRHVPYVMAAILSYLDATYPLLDNDEVRLGLWTVDVPLKTAHALRRQINTSSPFDRKILAQYDPPVAVAVLKLYLLELPDSLVPAQYYEVIKAIESDGLAGSADSRYMAIQNTFGQLRVSNIATLDALTAHLKRLTTIADAAPADVDKIAREVGGCILRPKQQTPLTLGDTFPAQLVKDLLQDRDRLFAELKRQAQPARESEDVRRRESVERRLSHITTRLKSRLLDGAAGSPPASGGPDGSPANGSAVEDRDTPEFADAPSGSTPLTAKFVPETLPPAMRDGPSERITESASPSASPSEPSLQPSQQPSQQGSPAP